MAYPGVYGWADVRRGYFIPDKSAQLLGVFTETDFRKNVVTADFAFVGSDNPRDLAGVQRGGSGAYFGASSTQRFGDINTAFRINTSSALNGTGTAVHNCALLFAEVSPKKFGANDNIFSKLF